MSERDSGPARKYQGIDQAGRAALKEGAVTPHVEFPDSLDKRFNVSMRFTQKSEQAFKDTIGSTVSELEASLGLSFILAGRDFTLHSTQLEGLYEGPPEGRQDVFNRLQETKVVRKLAEATVGRTVTYECLLPDKANLLLTSLDIPDWVLQAREQLAQAYSNSGLKPLLLTDLLHISAARMTRLPAENAAETFQAYLDKVSELAQRVAKNPLVLEVETIHVGSPLPILRRNLSAR